MNHIDRQTTSTGRAGFWRDGGGTMAIEFAFAVPLILVLIIGVLEASRYLMLHLKVQHAAVTVADLVTRDETTSESVIADIFNVVGQILSPYPIGDASITIITAITKSPDQDPRIGWQRSGAGTLVQSSTIGNAGDVVVTIPGGISVRDDESILAVEVYYQFEPFYFDLFPPQMVQKTAYFRPRLGALTSVD